MALSLEAQPLPLPVPSASVQARQRFGAEPLAQIFDVLWSAPDSADNRQTLGSGATQYGTQPWPMARGLAWA